MKTILNMYLSKIELQKCIKQNLIELMRKIEKNHGDIRIPLPDTDRTHSQK